MVTQSGMPFLTPDWLRKHAATLRGAFQDVAFYLTSVPSYAGGPMAHGFLSAGPDALRVPVEILTERHHASGLALRCWTPGAPRRSIRLARLRGGTRHATGSRDLERIQAKCVRFAARNARANKKLGAGGEREFTEPALV